MDNVFLRQCKQPSIALNNTIRRFLVNKANSVSENKQCDDVDGGSKEEKQFSRQEQSIFLISGLRDIASKSIGSRFLLTARLLPVLAWGFGGGGRREGPWNVVRAVHRDMMIELWLLTARLLGVS